MTIQSFWTLLKIWKAYMHTGSWSEAFTRELTVMLPSAPENSRDVSALLTEITVQPAGTLNDPPSAAGTYHWDEQYGWVYDGPNGDWESFFRPQYTYYDWWRDEGYQAFLGPGQQAKPLPRGDEEGQGGT
jgi:hypothetical protein